MKLCLTLALVSLHLFSAAQEYVRTKEGRAIYNKRHMVYLCLNRLNKGKADTEALRICECQVEKMDQRFTNKQFKKHAGNGIIDFQGLLSEDSVVEKDVNECFQNSGITYLLQAEIDKDGFISNCVDLIWKTAGKVLDSARVKKFCDCQLQFVREKKLTDSQIKVLDNPNSDLFFDIIAACDNPFLAKNEEGIEWTRAAVADVHGPETDTIDVVSLSGITLVKMKIGPEQHMWLFDTGSSDMVIDSRTEQRLKIDSVLNSGNYLGVFPYELANGMVDTCRRYKVNNLKIGKFTVNNVFVSVSDTGKRFIMGKSLMNKFSQWILNNEQKKLILFKH